nr:ADP-ribosylation factor GTPase-activating protein AGD3-like [Tanacetum cinerariifolium]
MIQQGMHSMVLTGCKKKPSPDMIKFSHALKELGTYNENLGTQIEHTLSDRLLRFGNVEFQDIKEARKRFDNADAVYSQIRDKYLSLRRSTQTEIASATEEIILQITPQDLLFTREIDDPLTNESLDGCSLLHVACQTADYSMVELLLQHGSNINASDLKGQTPLRYIIIRGRLAIAKLLLSK